MKYKQYIGILLGALYGLLYRSLCEIDFGKDIFDFNIYSVSFVWVLPIVIGIIPILFAREEILKSRVKQFFFPVLSVLLFFLFALSSGLEDWLCLLIIALPFLFAAGLAGLVLGFVLKEKTPPKLYSIVLLPFLLSPLEARLPDHGQAFSIQTAVIIEASQAEVWASLIEVPEIREEEYNHGFFNYIGVPRPIKSKLETINGTAYRIGYFTDGLKLYESISELDSLCFVNFKIHIDQSELRDLPTDKHLLNSDYFKFENISYTLEAQQGGQVKLILNCDYTIESKLNSYANFWAKLIVEDFEVRLLEVLKKKIEAGKAEEAY